MSPDEFIRLLEEALRAYRFDDVRSLIERMDPSCFTDSQVNVCLRALRGKRLFHEMEQVASLSYLVGKDDPTIRRQWAQALLDQNRVSQGLLALKGMSVEFAGHPKEGPEVRGLLGRAYKQRFVNEGDPDDLRRAINAYRFDWRTNGDAHRWHGINLVALLKRAARATRSSQDVRKTLIRYHRT